MKTGKHLIVYGLLAGLGLAASTTARAADQNSADLPNASTIRRSSMMNDKRLNDPERENKLIGKTVLTTDNQKLGKIENVIVDLESGRTLYAVIGSGGILGAGEKKYA